MSWNLKELFSDEEELQNYILQTQNEVIKFEEIYKDKLNDLNGEKFYDAMKEYENLNKRISKISTFAHLNFSLDMNYGKTLAKLSEKCDEISQNLLFFELQFSDLDSQKQDEFIKKSQNFAYYLTLLQRHKRHLLSFLEEKILLKTSPVGASAFSRLFDESMARMKFEFRGEKISEEKVLSFLHDKDREIRKEAAFSLTKTLNENSHLLTYIYNMIKTDLRISCELRGYERGEDIMHEENQISKSSVDALINATEKNFGIVGKYYEKKREILGLDELFDYDRYAPMGESSDDISFAEAKNIVLNAFENFSPEFAKIAKKAFDEDWIDEKEQDGKQSGAFSHSGSDEVHPFVLLNYTGKRRDVFTLAHELGHAIHQYLSYKVGFFGSFTPLTTAETASVFCEMLTFDYLRKNLKEQISKCEANSPQYNHLKFELRAMIGAKLEDIFATLYRQIGFTTFERRIHENADELDTEQINKIWLEESLKMFDGKVTLRDDYKIWWSYIPHFIHTPFYCYSYGYAQLLVTALYGLYKSKKLSNFSEIYTEFLSAGGSDEPKKLVEKFGFDINDPEFWEIGLREISDLTDEFIKG